jgi:O-antigen ligase
MKLFRALSHGSSRFQDAEFVIVLGWALLYPAKIGYVYFLGFMLLLAAFTLRRLFMLKSIAVSRFSLFLLAFNSIFVFSAYFSPHPLRSLLFVGDVLLVSLWFLFFYLEKSDMERCLRLAALVISLSSLAVLFCFALQGGRLPVTPVFRNPILQGIASAMAALVFLHSLLQRFGRAGLLGLVLNALAVVIAASKAAFLGLVLFAAAMVLHKRRKWLAYLGAALLLLILLPNPMRRMAVHSVRHDPYVLDRLDIWNMSARMYRRHLWVGVGPDLFVEAARRFNFPQEKGLSRFGKLPESPHSDYWKIITENGLPGLAFVVAFLFFGIRFLLASPRFALEKSLLAFMMVQMLFFNFVFGYFFLILFFLLLAYCLPPGQRFLPLRPAGRGFFSAMLLVALVGLYLLPYLANRCLDQAEGEKDLPRRHSLLRRAALLSPLDERVPLAEAALLRAFVRTSGNLEAWSDAAGRLQRAQRLDGNGTTAFILESGLFRDLLGLGVRYPELCEEVLAPLRRAEGLDPFNPFLKLQQAAVLREFGRGTEARSRARAALELEPDYVEAISFIHDLDGLPAADGDFRQRIDRIQAKVKGLRLPPGSYLYKLYGLAAKDAAAR